MNNIQGNKDLSAPAPQLNSRLDPSVTVKNNDNIPLEVPVKKVDVAQASQPSKDAIEKAAQDIQNFVRDMGRNLNFSVDEVTGYNVVKVINPETNEIIRQLPSEELLKIARNMKELGSVLVSQKA